MIEVDLSSLQEYVESGEKPRRAAKPKPTPESIRLKALEQHAGPEEEALDKSCWFPYRRMPAFERTCLFVFVYDAVMSAHLVSQNAGNFSLTGRGKVSVLKKAEKESPWLSVKDGVPQLSRRWLGYMKARRQADAWFMSYADYVAGALHAAQKRNWPYMPSPGQLTNDKLLGRADGFEEATIPWYYRDLYRDKVRFCDAPYFQAQHYRGEPLQVEYLAYIAGTLRSTTGDRAADLWARYQRDGKITSSLSFADALSQYRVFQ